MARVKQTCARVRRPSPSQRIPPTAQPAPAPSSELFSRTTTDSSSSSSISTAAAVQRRQREPKPSTKASRKTEKSERSEKSDKPKKSKKSSSSKITSSPAVKRSKKHRARTRVDSDSTPISLSDSSSPGISLISKNGSPINLITPPSSDGSRSRLSGGSSAASSPIVILPAYSKLNQHSPIQSRILNYASNLPSQQQITEANPHFNIDQYGSFADRSTPLKPYMHSGLSLNFDNPQLNTAPLSAVRYYPDQGLVGARDVDHMNKLIRSGKLRQQDVPEYVRQAQRFYGWQMQNNFPPFNTRTGATLQRRTDEIAPATEHIQQSFSGAPNPNLFSINEYGTMGADDWRTQDTNRYSMDITTTPPRPPPPVRKHTRHV